MPKRYQSRTDQNRTKEMKLRLSPDEYEQVKTTAELCGITQAEYLRSMVLGGQLKPVIHLSCSIDQLQPLVTALNRIGNNLNQIAHHLNSGNTLEEDALTSIKEMQKTLWKETQTLHNLFGG